MYAWLYHRTLANVGAHMPDARTDDGGPWCDWCDGIPHRVHIAGAPCPVCVDDPATRAAWEAELKRQAQARRDGAA